MMLFQNIKSVFRTLQLKEQIMDRLHYYTHTPDTDMQTDIF